MDNCVITWESIKNLSPQLCAELKKILKDPNYQSIDIDKAIGLINNSEEIKYLISNFEQYEDATKKIIEIFESLITKELSRNITNSNLDLIISYVKNYEKQFKNSKDKYKGIEILNQFFSAIELEPELDLLISIYDNVELITNNIDNIAKANIEKIKDGSFTFSDKNNLLSAFIEVYCLKNNIEINLDDEESLELENIDKEAEPSIDQDQDFDEENYNAFQSDLARQLIIESKKYPVLTQDEIRSLIEKAQNGSTYALEKAILHNQRLVIKIVFKYLRRKVEFVDAFQEGCIGLTKAIEKFNLSKEFNFSTYAYWWIRQAITRSIADQSRLIRIPVHMNEKLNKFKRIQNELYKQLNREPSIEELAKAMHCKEDTILELLQFSHDAVSFNTKINDEDDTELVDFIGSETDIESDFDSNSFQENVTNFINTLNLPERQAYIALHRLDIPGFKKETLDVIGKKFNVTRERIRQLEKKVRKKIFCSQRAKEFCDLFPNPEKIYKLVLEERKKYYINEEDVVITHPNLATKIGATIERMNELVSKLNSEDKLFIETHYDNEFNPIEENWDINDDQKFKSIINKIKLAIKNPNYRAYENQTRGIVSKANLDKQIIRDLTPRLTITDQQLIYNIFDEEFDVKDVTLTSSEQNQLLKIINDYKRLINNPEYDPKAETNLANILNLSYEELDDLTESLSKNTQNFLMRHYDEFWNEKTKKTTEEKNELAKIIKLILKIKKSQKNQLIKHSQLANDIDELNSLELIIVMGLISGEKYNTSYIADFLNLEEKFVIAKIKERLLYYQNNYVGILKQNYTLLRAKKDKQEVGE